MDQTQIINGLLHGIYAVEAVRNITIHWIPLLELARTPFAVNLGILGVVLVWLLPQEKVRLGLMLLSLGCITIMTGLIFLALLLAALCVVWISARWLQIWAQRRQRHGWPLAVGWLIVNALYAPLFFVTLPSFGRFMSVGELVLFWGPAFVAFKSLHYMHLACRSRVSRRGRDGFLAFLLYMTHFASFWFGPYQDFRQFDGEVADCKQRQTRANQIEGIKRIAIGAVKFFILFRVINFAFFYQFDYLGPFSDRLFAEAGSADPGHLWLMMYLFAFRIMLFISALSDGVIGMNLMMGIRVPENSNWPILSRDILDFWRRWHMQAGVFLRDEILFTMRGRWLRYLAPFCVFAYSGFWHFPTLTSVLAFPLLQLALIRATHGWQKFWKRHARRDDWIHRAGLRYRLHDSPMSHLAGMLLVLNANVFSIVFIHDHFYSGSRILPRMFGF